MKKIYVLACLLFVFCLVIFTACNKNSSPDAMDKDTSYAFGMLMAFQMSGSMGLDGLSYDYDAFRDGFRDVNEAKETRLSQEKAIEKITEFFARMDEQAFIDGEKNREEGEDYLAANRLKSNVHTTPSGLQYEVLVEGSGEKPGPSDTVSVHYKGTLINGTEFDSSYSRGTPTEFPLYAVIPGWTEGLQLMSEGSTYRFVIPSDLAYGPNGAGSIPPNSTLIFEVELLSIIRY